MLRGNFTLVEEFEVKFPHRLQTSIGLILKQKNKMVLCGGHEINIIESELHFLFKEPQQKK